MSGRNRGGRNYRLNWTEAPDLGPSSFGDWSVVPYRGGFAIMERGKFVVRIFKRITRAPLIRVFITREGAKRWVEREERARVQR